MVNINLTIERKHLYGLAVLALVVGLLVRVGAWASDRFNDVPDSNIFHDDIDWLADAGVTLGCGGGDFCPKDSVTREQMAAFMHRYSKIALPGTTPPDGTTVRGVYRLRGFQASGPNTGASFDIFWGFEMPSNPEVHFVAAGAGATADCPGSFGDPQAVEGHLCVYETAAANSGGLSIYSSDNTANLASKFGAGIGVSAGGLGTFYTWGSWAITAGTP